MQTFARYGEGEVGSIIPGREEERASGVRRRRWRKRRREEDMSGDGEQGWWSVS